MKVIKPSYEILTPINGIDMLKKIELAGRVCYKSENLITTESAIKFVESLINKQHYTPLEHESISIKLVCDRGVMAEITRHRLASFNVESSRYCNYSKDKFGNELTFIQPCFTELNSPQYLLWESTCRMIENNYFALLQEGWKPEEARSILPNSLKTEIIMTANLREWRHVLKLRSANASHSQMRELMIPLLNELKTKIPVIFNDI